MAAATTAVAADQWANGGVGRYTCGGGHDSHDATTRARVAGGGGAAATAANAGDDGGVAFGDGADRVAGASLLVDEATAGKERELERKVGQAAGDRETGGREREREGEQEQEPAEQAGGEGAGGGVIDLQVRRGADGEEAAATGGGGRRQPFADYDFSRSTEENYAAESWKEFTGR